MVFNLLKKENIMIDHMKIHLKKKIKISMIRLSISLWLNR